MTQHFGNRRLVVTLCLAALSGVGAAPSPAHGVGGPDDYWAFAPLSTSTARDKSIHGSSQVLEAAETRTRQRLAGIRMPFVANSGQTDSAVAYYASTFAGTIFVTRDGRIVYSLPGAKSQRPGERSGETTARKGGWSLTETVVGGRGRPRATDPASTRVSHFIGDDPARWTDSRPTFDGVSLGEVWPGISLDLRAHGTNMEKMFRVEPGADPSRIRMSVAGARSLRVDEAGALVMGTDFGEVTFTPPVALQERQGVRHAVEVAYVVDGWQYGFRLEGYDPALPLLIDPLLQSTYLGGGSGDINANALAIHPTSGDVYVAGYTTSTNFPGTVGGAQAAKSGGYDVFVARLDATLTVLDQATYLGGSGDDYATAVAVHPVSGEVYVTGSTASTNFPGITGGAQAAYGGNVGVFQDSPDAFVARLNAALTTLEQATYLGGNGSDRANSLAIHPASGDVYVAGYTNFTTFPHTTGGAQPTFGGFNTDGFVARLNAALTTLVQATYLGGNGTDVIQGLAINPTSGDIYVTGSTVSTNFPGTAGGAQALPASNTGSGLADAFVARLSSALTVLRQATYLGSSSWDQANAVAIHPVSGDVYVVGHTEGNSFPGTAGGSQVFSNGSHDAFVVRLNPGLTTLAQATYLGGSNVDHAYALAIDLTTGDVYVAGETASVDFPGTTGATQAANDGGQDAFVAHLNAALTVLSRATYLGGSNDDVALGFAIHPVSGDVYVTGYTKSTDFPGTTGGAQIANGGPVAVFVAQVSEDLAPPEPRMEAEPANLVFTNITVETIRDLTVTVRNVGDAPLVGTAAVSGAGFSVVSGASYTLTKGQAAAVTVRFAPTGTAPANGTLTLTGGGGASVSLTGSAIVGPYLLLNDTPLPVTAGPATAIRVTARNIPAAPIQYVGLWKTGAPLGISGFSTFVYVPPTGMMNFTLPTAPGTYEFRWISDSQTIAISQAVTIPNQHKLTITVTGPGTVTAPGIACPSIPSTCARLFDHGATVTLMATPTTDLDATFAGWSNPCVGTSPCQVTLLTDTTVSATFATPRAYLEVTPRELRFGEVGFTVPRDLSLVVRNSGGARLTGMSSISFQDPDFGFFSLMGTTTYALDPGQSQSITVRFAPTEVVGDFGGGIDLTGSADGNRFVPFRGSSAVPPDPNILGTLPTMTATGVNLNIGGNGFRGTSQVFFENKQYEVKDFQEGPDAGSSSSLFIEIPFDALQIDCGFSGQCQPRTAEIRVQTPGASGSSTFPFHIVKVSPVTVPSGGTGTLTLEAATPIFEDAATMVLDQKELTTRQPDFDKPTELVADLVPTDTPVPGVFAVLIRENQRAVGGYLVVGNPVPTATWLAPTQAEAGSSTTRVRVWGTGFFPKVSTVQVDGNSRDTRYFSATALDVDLQAADLKSPGTRSITVFNALPGGGNSSPALTFTVSVPSLALSVTVTGGVGTESVSSTPAGISACRASGGTCQASFPAGTPVTLAPTAASTSSFKSWTITQGGGTCAGTGDCVLTMNNAKAVTATFETAPLTVTFGGNGTGTVTSSPAGINCTPPGPCSGNFRPSPPTQVVLTATPSAGFGASFTGCDSTGRTPTSATCTVSMAGSRNVTVSFGTVQLSVEVRGPGTGSVTSSPPGISCPGTCSAPFPSGASVAFTATAADDSSVGWAVSSNEACPSASTCTVTADAAKKLTATFSTAALSVTFAGSGTGSVTSNPVGISCSASPCTANFRPSPPTSVVLTASPGPSSLASFTGCDSTGGVPPSVTCTVSVDKTKNVTVTFAPAATLTVTKTGNGSISGDGGFDCPESSSVCPVLAFATGTTVQLTARPAPGFGVTFAGCLSTTPLPSATCTVKMDKSKSVIVRFNALPTFTLRVKVSASSPSFGVVTGLTAPCSNTCDETFFAGTQITLTATAADIRAGFQSWSGCTSSSQNVCRVTVGKNLTVTAAFSTVVLRVTKTGSGSGTVRGLRIECGADCDDQFPPRSTQTLTADPAPGSILARWTGCSSTSGNTCDVLVGTTAKSVTAQFVTNRLTVRRAGNASGTVTGNVGIACGDQCTLDFVPQASNAAVTVTLTAQPDPGALLTFWAGCTATTLDKKVCSVRMDAPHRVTATFTTNRLTVKKAGTGTGLVVGEGAAAAVDCGAACTLDVLPSAPATVTVTATPDASSGFTRWAGCKSTNANVCTVLINATKAVTATFTSHKLTVTPKSVGGGTGSVAGPGIDCGPDCTQGFAPGTQVTLTATPSVDSGVSWNGCTTAQGVTCTLAMRASRLVTVTFSRIGLTVSPAGTGGGVIAAPGISCIIGPRAVGDCATFYPPGTTVTLAAVAAPGSTFTGWTITGGATCPGVGSCTVSMTVARTVTPTFKLTP